MFDPSIFIIAIAYAAGIIVIAKIGAGPTESLVGLFGSPQEPGRAYGVQEEDVPRFVFRDATSTSAA